MAEKVELDVREISLLEWSKVGEGKIEMDDDELKFFEKDTWKLFVYMIGQKLVEKYKDRIYGECLINFFPGEKEEFYNLMSVQNTSILGKDLICPSFYIKFDKNLHIEFCDRKEEKIPKNLLFMILCR